MSKFETGDAVIAQCPNVFKKLMHVVIQKDATTICVYTTAAHDPITVEVATAWLTAYQPRPRRAGTVEVI
jgi:hypothetical protein